MRDSLYSIIKTETFVDSTVALRLLRARNLPLVMTFLFREFKDKEQFAIPYQILVQRLGDYLEEIEYRDDEEEIKTEKLILDLDEKAKFYIDRWIDSNYLRNIMDDNLKEPYVLLSKHVEKVFQIFELLKEKEFVGTESKFKDIFYKLRDIIENANPDKEKRLAELEKRKLAIDEEIRKVKIDGYVSTYEDYQIKSRFDEVNRLANELIGDFKEVEDNFKDITRKIYERQQLHDLTKGKLLQDTFDALFELKNTDQGKSFYAFWQFMLDDNSQKDFQNLTREVYQVLEDREIAITNRSLRKFKTLLHLAARKVLDKNNVLANKLSKEILARDQLETRKTKELISSIHQLAIQKLHKPTLKETWLEIDGNCEIYLPLERKLGEKPLNNIYSSIVEKSSIDIQDIDEISKIFSADLIDKKALLVNVKEILKTKTQTSLLEVIITNSITKGLPELLAYISLVNTSSKFFINEEIKESILFDPTNNKYLEVPQIIFSK